MKQKHHIDLIHYMSGSCRKIIDSKVKYLVAYGSGGDKYRVSSFIHSKSNKIAF